MSGALEFLINYKINIFPTWTIREISTVLINVIELRRKTTDFQRWFDDVINNVIADCASLVAVVVTTTRLFIGDEKGRKCIRLITDSWGRVGQDHDRKVCQTYKFIIAALQMQMGRLEQNTWTNIKFRVKENCANYVVYCIL